MGGYLLSWGLTAVLGAPQVRNAVIDSFPLAAGEPTNGIRAITSTLVPFLVSVHYGNRTLDVVEWHYWVFGVHGRIRTLRFRFS